MTRWIKREIASMRLRVGLLPVICDALTRFTGLHRQSELTVKEPFRVMVDKNAGRTVIDVIGLGGSFVPAEEEDGEGEDVKRLV